MKLLLIIPDTSGTISFQVCGKTSSDKLRAYQHFITILLTDSSLVYRTYGTGLMGLLRGSNLCGSVILDIANITCISALRGLSEADRDIIQYVTVKSVDIQDTTCGLRILMTFTDGLSIAKEFA